MQIICIANGKGGLGKTTVSANIAEGLYLEGNNVVLVDGDPTNPSLSRWLRISKDRREALVSETGYLYEGTRLTGVDSKTYSKQFVEFMGKYGNDCEFMIVDTGASQADKSAIVMTYADLVIIPFGPSESEAEITAQGILLTARDMVVARASTPTPLYAKCLWNKKETQHNSVANRNFEPVIEQVLEHFGLEFFKTHLHDMNDWRDTHDAGETCFSVNPTTRKKHNSGKEVRDLLAEVLEALD